jgi:hypothetical protein
VFGGVDADRSIFEAGPTARWSWCYLRCYRMVMGNVVKRSLSFPPDVFEAVEEEARVEGVGVSAAFTEAARQWILVRRGLRAVAEWESDNGPLTGQELAAADRLLDGQASA